MTYKADIISILEVICDDFSIDLGVDLSFDASQFDVDLSYDSTTDVVRMLTVLLPQYDAYLLSYFRTGSSPDISTWVEPFKTLFPLIEGGNRVAVQAYRQLALFGKKLVAPTSKALEAVMVDRLYSTDQGLPLMLPESPILRLARILVAKVLGQRIPAFDGGFPCGSGAAAEKDLAVPFRYESELLIFTDAAAWFGLPVERVDEYESRVVTVPKDARGPRVICCEPNTLMMLQKHVQLNLHHLFNSHALTRGRVNILDQGINKSLALLGSTTGRLATLDMAEASDRVSLALVEAIMPSAWYALLTSLRSKCYHDGTRTVTMRKFAPMGSALCFPVETLCFWAIASAAVARKRGCTIEKASQLVTVHGDDTIVPTDCAVDVIEALESVALKVNVDKSFFAGPFRESCGGDYYLGYPVEPVRHNHMWLKDSNRDEQLLILANGFYIKGLWHTAKKIRSLMSRKDLPSTFVDGDLSDIKDHSSMLEFSYSTYCRNFVGGLASVDSLGECGLITDVGIPMKHKARPTDAGRYNQYWLNIESLKRSDVGAFPAEGWEGAYTHIIRRKPFKGDKKKKKNIGKTSTTFTERDKRKIRRKCVPYDLGASSNLIVVAYTQALRRPADQVNGSARRAC